MKYLIIGIVLILTILLFSQVKRIKYIRAKCETKIIGGGDKNNCETVYRVEVKVEYLGTQKFITKYLAPYEAPNLEEPLTEVIENNIKHLPIVIMNGEFEWKKGVG